MTTPDSAVTARYRKPLAGPLPWSPALDTMLSHRSVRAYRPDPLPPGTLDVLVAAAQSAATSSNLQVWSVVAVTDPTRKERLAALAGNQRHIAQAPLFLLFVADLARAAALAPDQELGGLDYLEMALVAVIDAALAGQNAAVAAESLGLGTVYIGAMRNQPEAVAAEIGLPPRCVVAFGLCVGFEDGAAAVKPRLPQSVVLHHEQYRAATPEALAGYDDDLAGFQREQAMAPVGWQRSMINRVRDAAALHGRDTLRATMARMGFALR